MKNKTYKINEIFESLQGEGFYSGYPVTFIRFAGCNQSCFFCDTDHTCRIELIDNEIIEKIKEFKNNIIVLTGGEPGLQVDFELVELFKKNGLKVHIETNGTIKLPENIDWVTVSPKKKKVVDQEYNELKVLFNDQQLDQYNYIDSKYKYLQPIDINGLMNIGQTISKIKEEKGWILSLQQHKILNIK